jgi:hypothetical protein
MADETPAAAIPVTPDAAAVLRPRQEWYLTGEDNLRVTSASAMSGLTLSITGRVYDPSRGVVVPFERTHTPNGDRTLKRSVIALGAGFVLDVTVRVTVGNPLMGQTYVILELVRGLDGPLTLVGTFASGYVTASQGVGWPGSPIISSTDGEPAVRYVQGTDPAAGLEITETVPTGARWEVMTFSAILTNGAIVANRIPALVFSKAPHVVAKSVVGASIAENLSRLVSWGPGIQQQTAFDSPGRITVIPAKILLLAGMSLSTSTINFGVGDQYTDVAYVVREWLEVN